jgi:hypothetical protein
MNEIIKKNGIKFGIIIGLLAIVFEVIKYLGGLAIYKIPVVGLVIGLVYWIIRIYQSSVIKKEFNNIISLKEVFTALLISTTLGILISILFNFVFYNFIVAEFKPELNDFMNSSMVELFKIMGRETNKIKELAENDNFSIINLGKSGVFSILFSSFFNLILAAIFKNKSKDQF